MPEMEYAVLDVFAERALEGNAVAVFADGRGLTEEAMQRIAREMNLSETTFVLPREEALERERGVRVRIFTTEEELPFAGHPTLGTATWLRESRGWCRGAQEVALELNVGRIPVAFGANEEGRPGVFGTMRQNDPEFLPVGGTDWPMPEEFAEALGLAAGEIGFAGSEAPVAVVSTGCAFCVVPLRSMEAARRLQISQAKARPMLARIGARFFYCVARVEAGAGSVAAEARWHGRMQFYNGEDPATGSAAGCVAAWLVRHGLIESGREAVLEQGVEMRRPSRLHLRASRREDGGITDVFVGGRTISVANGRFFLP